MNDIYPAYLMCTCAVGVVITKIPMLIFKITKIIDFKQSILLQSLLYFLMCFKWPSLVPVYGRLKNHMLKHMYKHINVHVHMSFKYMYTGNFCT